MTVDSGQANLAVCCAFVDALAASGLKHAIICPGSRSTPLAVALAAHDALTTRVHVDERSAAFFAFGMARQLSQPIALLCTSGTAAANFSPAVAEASLSRIPLLILTADRPPELRGWGAAQTIDQIDLYGSHVKWFVDMPVPDGDRTLVRHARATAARAFATASGAPAGPVHLNFPFREPLIPLDLRPPLDLTSLFAARQRDCSSHASSRPDHTTTIGARHAVPDHSSPNLAALHIPAAIHLDNSALDSIAELLAFHRRGIIVAGPGESPSLATALAALSSTSGFPVLADPLSGMRFGPHDRSGAIESYDSFLRNARIAECLAPDSVIRVGAPPTSKPLQQFLSASPGVEHLVIDTGAPRDPFHLASRYLTADPAETICRLASAMPAHSQPDPEWLAHWRDIDRLTTHTIASKLESADELFEGRACAEVASLLPNDATLVVGNSMPIRDVDTFVRGDSRPLRILGTRGANGIDGVASAALGAAAASPSPVVLILGDLSFYHDMNGLLAAKQHGLSITIVVLNNNGGGIFSFLPQSQQLEGELFESLFGTPINLDISRVAALYGCAFERPKTWGAFRRAVSTSIAQSVATIIEVVTDRQRNVELHRAISAAVTEALEESMTGAMLHA